MEEPIIGIDESDPYGRILSHPYRDAGLEPRFSMRGRFAQTIVSLVRHGLGVSVIDEFSVAEVYMPGLVRRPLKEPASINAWVLTKHGRQLSSFAEFTVERFRHELQRARAREAWDPAPLAAGTGCGAGLTSCYCDGKIGLCCYLKLLAINVPGGSEGEWAGTVQMGGSS